MQGFPGRDRITISELAEWLQIRHHSAVGLVDRLVAHGLLAREPAASDRRQVYITLTDRGEAVLEQLAAAHKAELRRPGPEMLTLLDRLNEGAEPAAPADP